MIHCPRCDGIGYTQATADTMRTMFNREHHAVVEVETIRKGSGCELCLGVGEVADAVRVEYIKGQRRHEVRRIS